MTTATFTKNIEMQFERTGKRTRLVGFIGELRDEANVLIHSQSYDTKPEAEQALNVLAHELLIDYAERGLVDTLPKQLANGCDIAYTNRPSDYTHDVYIEGCWAATAKNWHSADVAADEVRTRGHLDVVRCSTCGGEGDCPDCDPNAGPDGVDLYAAAFEDEPGLCTCGAVATLVVRERSCEAHICGLCFLNDYENNHEDSRAWEVEPLAIDPPGDNPLGDTEGDPVPPPEPAFPQRSYTRADKQIEQTMQRNRQCPNCGDAHYGWQCPEIGDAVTAIAVYDTDELVRLWGASRALLVTKLARLTEPQLLCQAMDFAAWLNKRTQANLAARSVLVIWEQMINEHWRRSPVVAA